MKQYQTTRQECQQRIKGVCEGCGRELEPIETIDNSGNPTFWIGCNHCSCFRSGVKKLYFEIARSLVEKEIIIPYSHMVRKKEDKDHEEYWLDSQTAGLSHSIARIHLMILKSEKRENL